MTEFWESSFVEKQTMWGFEPSDSAISANDFFLEKKVKDILLPGIGYGRNAKIFIDNGYISDVQKGRPATGITEGRTEKFSVIVHFFMYVSSDKYMLPLVR